MKCFRKWLRTFARFAVPSLSVIGVLFIILDHSGFWDRVRGVDLLEAVAARLDTSYADVSRVVRPSDPEFRGLIALFRKYSSADLPTDREPKVIARSVAVSSAKLELGNGRIAEWTAPETPIVVLYADWPGQDVPLKDSRIVGTLGQLHEWIARDRGDFKYLVSDFILGGLAALIGLLALLIEPSGRAHA